MHVIDDYKIPVAGKLQHLGCKFLRVPQPEAANNHNPQLEEGPKTVITYCKD